MTIDAPPERTLRRLDPRRGTSAATWACILLAIAILIAVRLPQLERLVAERTSALLTDLGDPELGAASVRVGAITAIGLHVVVGVVVALAVGLLERWLGPAAIAPRPWARLGVGGAMVAVVGIGLQAAAVALAIPAVEKSVVVLAAILVVALVVPLAFRDARDRLAYPRALVVAAITGVLLWLQ